MAPRKDDYIAAIDIGTSKVATVIAMRRPDGTSQVVGLGHQLCQGLDGGMITCMDKTERAIRASVSQAERTFGREIEHVYVSVTSANLHSEPMGVDVELAGQPVEQADIDRVLSAAREQINSDGRTVLHAQPVCYSVDGAHSISNPLDMQGERLGVDVHVISAETCPVNNLETCVRRAHLDVVEFVAGPLAVGYGCLSNEQRDMGTAVVDLGAGVTNVAIFVRGMLVGCASIPMGSSDITNDICSTLMTPRVHAERLKTLFGTAMSAPADNADMIEVIPVSNAQGTMPYHISKAQLATIIRKRLTLIFNHVHNHLEELGFVGPDARQIVLTGGGSQLASIDHFASAMLGKSVLVGRPIAMAGLPDTAASPSFSAVLGILHYVLNAPQDARFFDHVTALELPRGKFKRLKNWLIGTW